MSDLDVLSAQVSRLQQEIEPRRGVKHCSNCRKAGHSRPTCPELEAARRVKFRPVLTPAPAPARPPRVVSCSLCGSTEHNARSCGLRPQGNAKRCRTCEGMSHRRPRGKKCPGCGLRYQPEPRPTMRLLASSAGLLLEE